MNWARQSFPSRVEAKMKFVDAGRGELVKFLDAVGVETRWGAKHRWETLQHIAYRQERAKGSPLNMLISSLMFRGQDRRSARLTFLTGDAVVTIVMQNSNELLKLFESIPVERRTF